MPLSTLLDRVFSILLFFEHSLVVPSIRPATLPNNLLVSAQCRAHSRDWINRAERASDTKLLIYQDST